MGFYLKTKETGHAGGLAVLCWAQDVAVLGAGCGRAGRAGLGWARGLASAFLRNCSRN